MNSFGLGFCLLAFAIAYCQGSGRPPVRCKYQLKELEHGVIDAEIKEYYDPGDTIWYFCFEPYVLDGIQDVRCLPNGKWNHAPPRCVPKFKKCPRRDPPDNGSQSPDKPKYEPHDMVKYRCDEHFELKGAPKAFCAPNGQWTHPVPKCIAPKCPKLQAPKKGSLSPVRKEYKVGEMVVFECVKYYQIQGAEKLTCQRNGKWDNPEPICVRITCDPIDPPVDGSLTPDKDSYNVKDVITFECNDNFNLVGSEVSTCLPTGEFSDEAPQCVPVTCPRPDVTDGVSFTPDQDDYLVGEDVTFMCIPGTILVGVDNVECLKTGEWSDEFPICEPVTCPRPVVTDGVSFTPDQNEYQIGEDVTFKCIPGTTLVGVDVVECLETGEWSDDFPVCEPIQCERPVQNDNIDSIVPDQDLYDIGDEVTFRCSRGFKLVGSEISVCQEDQSWSPVEPTCMKIVVCRQPPKPSNSMQKPDQPIYQVGESIRYKCNNKFELKGEPVLTCQDNGEFDFRPPVCQRRCRRPYLPRKLSISPDKDYYYPGDEVEFECGEHYKLEGGSTLNCEPNGRWSSYIPSCLYSYSGTKSCKSRCKEVWGRGQPCQCNRYCKYFKSPSRFACCDDYTEYCS